MQEKKCVRYQLRLTPSAYQKLRVLSRAEGCSCMAEYIDMLIETAWDEQLRIGSDDFEFWRFGFETVQDRL